MERQTNHYPRVHASGIGTSCLLSLSTEAPIQTYRRVVPIPRPSGHLKQSPYFPRPLIFEECVWAMPFQTRVNDLLNRLRNCNDDNRAADLARQLKAALHEEIELMRAKTKSLTAINSIRRISTDSN
jgi:hypothetical protein